jgi:asparagine synthase (glutamine-hydrolysing)
MADHRAPRRGPGLDAAPDWFRRGRAAVWLAGPPAHAAADKWHLRGFAAKYRWRRTDLLRQLADGSPYHRWLDRAADNLTAPPPGPNEPLLDWGFKPRLPPWVTPATVDALRALIHDEAQHVQPLSLRRGQHRELEGMSAISRIARQLGQMTGRIGVELAAPYYDDRVVEAGLAVRPQDRITPWRYKPLILDAMRGIVPGDSLVRQTKANGACEESTGLRRNRANLLALWEDSRLARLGLVDATALGELCSRPIPAFSQIGMLHQTVAGEIWLRSLERSPLPRVSSRVSS